MAWRQHKMAATVRERRELQSEKGHVTGLRLQGRPTLQNTTFWPTAILPLKAEINPPRPLKTLPTLNMRRILQVYFLFI